jgi:hypothetical protein
MASAALRLSSHPVVAGFSIVGGSRASCIDSSVIDLTADICALIHCASIPLSGTRSARSLSTNSFASSNVLGIIYILIRNNVAPTPDEPITV